MHRIDKNSTLWTLAMELAPRQLEIARLHEEAQRTAYPQSEALVDRAEAIADAHRDLEDELEFWAMGANVFPWDVLDAAKAAHLAA